MFIKALCVIIPCVLNLRNNKVTANAIHGTLWHNKRHERTRLFSSNTFQNKKVDFILKVSPNDVVLSAPPGGQK